jgi:hypothetical protein
VEQAPEFVTVTFASLQEEPEDTFLDHTRELALDLREIGPVDFVPAVSAPGAKSAGEVVAGVLAIAATANPDYAQAVVQTVVAFLRRNENRRASLKVGDIELHIDQPTRDEVARIIDAMQTALDSPAAGRRRR